MCQKAMPSRDMFTFGTGHWRVPGISWPCSLSSLGLSQRMGGSGGQESLGNCFEKPCQYSLQSSFSRLFSFPGFSPHLPGWTALPSVPSDFSNSFSPLSPCSCPGFPPGYLPTPLLISITSILQVTSPVSPILIRPVPFLFDPHSLWITTRVLPSMWQ